MRIDNFRLSLWVTHPSADLSGFPDMFGLDSVRIWKAGEPRTTPVGNKLVGVNPSSYCCMKVAVVPEEGLSESIAAILGRLGPHRSIIDALGATGGRFMLNVGWFSPSNTGEVFEVHLLKAMADMNIDLGIDVYGGLDPSDPLPEGAEALS